LANDKRFLAKNGLQAPNISFSSSNAAFANSITATFLDTAGTLSFSGLSGQLFSITDSMTGTIFSVNDISGIPSIEVFDVGNVRLAEFSGNVAIGSANTSLGRLFVQGNSVTNGNITLTGGIIANGSIGTSGQTLRSNGTVAFWSTEAGGYTGSAGFVGSTGFTGSRGFDGSRGFTGSQGFTGSRGFDGSRGFTGSQGFTGSIGFTGSAGVGESLPVADGGAHMLVSNYVDPPEPVWQFAEPFVNGVSQLDMPGYSTLTGTYQPVPNRIGANISTLGEGGLSGTGSRFFARYINNGPTILTWLAISETSSFDPNNIATFGQIS